MKAIWVEKGKLKLVKLPKPRPKKGEVLIRVLYAGICNTDLEIVRGYMDFQGILGHEFIGIVEKGSSKWLGKRVVGEINLACGRCEYCQKGLSRHCPHREVLGILKKPGAFAEYLTLPEKNLHLVPDSISDLEAVFIEPLSASLRILDQLKIKKQDKVLILGDGKLAQLIARVLALKTKELLVAGRHQEKLALLSRLGIKTILAEELSKFTPEHSIELIIEATGNPEGLKTALKFIAPLGTIVLKSTYAKEPQIDLSQVVVNELKILGSRCGDFSQAIPLLEKNKVPVKDLISGIYPLEAYQRAFKKARERKSLKVILKCQS